jgi:hypothetical protein
MRWSLQVIDNEWFAVGFAVRVLDQTAQASDNSLLDNLKSPTPRCRPAAKESQCDEEDRIG